MSTKLCLIIVLLWIAPVIKVRAQPIHNVIQKFLADHNHFHQSTDVWGNYTLDMTIEAIINYTRVSSDSTYLGVIERFFRHKDYQFGDTINYRSIPFSDPYFALFSLKGNSQFIGPYLSESQRMMNTLTRTPEGAVCINHQNADYMLIDYLQVYGARMARSGYLSGDTAFYGECIRQFELYRAILQYPDSKLYSQGRGWLKNKDELSPSCWSRGQGWLIRGMVSALEFLPENSVYYRKMVYILDEFAEALINKQHSNGMWHTLPCLDFGQSHPEVSGTALISWYMAKALKKGYLSGEHYKEAVVKAVRGINEYILPDGTIKNVSKGPGPLYSVDEYKENFEPGDKHGPPAVIFALTTEYLN